MSNLPQALVYSKYGKPSEVLHFEEINIPQLGPHDALVALRMSVVNPSDFGLISGHYGRSRSLPTVAGREGVGEVIALGDAVTSLSLGSYVRMPEELGVWQQVICVSANALMSIPHDIPLEMACMAFINPPTAVRLLSDFVALQAGDWMIQNAANSALGFCIVGLARSLGVHTVNVVRDLSWRDELEKQGADIVVSEDSEYWKHMDEHTNGSPIKLGINSIGGHSVAHLIKAMGNDAQVVTVGAMVGDLIRFPTADFIFRNIQLKGFWMDAWFNNHSQEEGQAFMDDVFSFMKKGYFDIPVAQCFPFEDVIQAIESAGKYSRKGKVLIDSQWGFR